MKSINTQEGKIWNLSRLDQDRQIDPDDKQSYFLRCKNSFEDASWDLIFAATRSSRPFAWGGNCLEAGIGGYGNGRSWDSSLQSDWLLGSLFNSEVQLRYTAEGFRTFQRSDVAQVLCW